MNNGEILKGAISNDILRSIYELINSKVPLDGDININLISSSQIKDLNKEFRNIDTETDVLSFEISDLGLLGEIYLSIEYIKKNTKEEKVLEEILRMIIHGTLHLVGYDHVKHFEESNYKDEAMYEIQEEVLNLIKEKYEINSRIG